MKKVIGVVSGKGGVGKSLVTSMMAVSMNRKGRKTAILDADITGPSIPMAFGIGNEGVMTSPDGKLIDDFLFVTTPRTIHTCNAPSPAATSAIPIGAHIVSKVQTLLASQSNPGRTLRAARSVDALHAAFNQ